MMRSIIFPSGETRLMRLPYILIYILLHVIYLSLAFNLDERPIILLLCMLLFTYLKVNINAQRTRDSGLKARFVVIPSIVIYLASSVLGYFFGAECESLAVRLSNGFDFLLFLILILAPTQEKSAA
ncbi:MAG: hypothetical protein JO014_25235 [Metakosakonia sp.]|nr:hypothetical protein [Phytobacter sp.]MBV8876023.1 hypothetical protein [Phytobacter sp.]